MLASKRPSQTEDPMIRLTTAMIWLLTVTWSSTIVAQSRTPPHVAAAKRSRPNIIVFLADDLGYGELGCQGNPEIPTPHIDGLAQGGVRMTNAYVAASFCSASRAGLLTGRYPTRFGYEFNPVGAQNEDPAAGLPSAETTLAEHLHAVGYTTALIGKWHLGGTARYHPLRHGFEEFFGFLHEGHFYVPPPYRKVTTMLRRRRLPNGGQGRWTSGDSHLIYGTHLGYDEPAYDANNPILRNGQPEAEEEYLTEALTREAVDFLDRVDDRPFFLFLAYNAVHSPLQATNPSVKRFGHIKDIQRRIFAGMLSSLDQSVGKVMSKLREYDLQEQTLIFFLSDNGGPTRELTSSNRPLRGEKGTLWEGGIRVPFLVQWKGQIPAGHLYEEPVLSLDIFATASAAAGVQQRPTQPIDGVNLLPYLRGTKSEQPHKQLFWRTGLRAAVRVGHWKLVRNPEGRASKSAAWQLYNLAEDLSESVDVAEKHPTKREQLESVWQEVNQQMREPIWRPSR